MKQHVYIAIDLKSFYASAECVARNLDPLTTNLVVADESRTEKTICLAVSPSLKAYGIPGRARLFEVIAKVQACNAERLKKIPGHFFLDSSVFETELKRDPTLKIDYLIAKPRMAYYIEISSQIYEIYLKYVAPEDIHVYSIDEVFIDATSYLKLYKMNAHDFTRMLIRDVLHTTGITATAGIGENLYLCKVAMDILAKRCPPDPDGVRIAALTEARYRSLLWDHQPLRDFWRIGKGYVKSLEKLGLYTMGDIARFSLTHEDQLFEIFGVNAELLIDHAWGIETCTMADIKAYKPENNSHGAGQVLAEPYCKADARIVLREMVETLSLELLEQSLVTDALVITVGYDISSLNSYHGAVKTDYYGRKMPKSAHGTACLNRYTSSTMLMTREVLALYDQIVDESLLIRRLNIAAIHVIDQNSRKAKETRFKQINLFHDFSHAEQDDADEKQAIEKDQKIQAAMLQIKKKYGKNAVLKGTSYQEKATAKERNEQIGGHKA